MKKFLQKLKELFSPKQVLYVYIAYEDVEEPSATFVDIKELKLDQLKNAKELGDVKHG